MVATLGVCPFCVHADQPIFAWDGIKLASQSLFSYAGSEFHLLQAQDCCAAGETNCGGVCSKVLTRRI